MNGKLITLVAALLLTFPAGASAVTFPGGGGGPTTSGSGGGGGGKVKWFNLENSQHSAGRSPIFQDFGSGGSGQLRVLSAPATLGNLRDGNRSNNAAMGRSSTWRQATLAVLQASCGIPIKDNSQGNCPLWWNTTGSSSSSENSTWLQVHANSPTGGIGIENQLAGYNVRIWRENAAQGRFELIFQRQVGVAKQATENEDFTDAIKATKAWWYGGFSASPNGIAGQYRRGGSFSLPGDNNGQIVGAGMIGNGQGHIADCQRNLSSGINYPSSSRGFKILKRAIGSGRTCYWEGRQMGPNAFSYQNSGVRDIWNGFPRRSGLPDGQFGFPTANNFLGIDGKGQRESLRFSWILPNGNGATRAGFGFALNGAPGVFYAVQVIGIDTREKIIPIDRPRSFTFGTDKEFSTPSNSEQFFKVFLASPLPAFINTNPPFHSDEPGVSTSLRVKSPVQTRERVRVRSELDVNDLEFDYSYSALLPRMSSLSHFTPQLDYSSSASPYGGSYVRYEGLPGPVSEFLRAPSAQFEPPARRDGSDFNTQIVRVEKASILKVDIPDVSEWRMAWLQPTLENPCPTLIPQFPYPEGDTAWPVTPAVCQTGDPSKETVFNAWDDLLWSGNTWDAQHVARKIDDDQREDLRGPVNNQLLRCNASSGGAIPVAADTDTVYQMLTDDNQSPSGSPNRAGDYSFGYPGRSQFGSDREQFQACRNAVYPLLGNVSNINEQEAQGIIDIRGPGAGEGAALITLDSNRLDVVSAPTLQSLDGSPDNPLIIGNSTFKRDGQIELNLCKQGLPPGAAYLRAARQRNDAGTTVQPALQGDNGCRGYALRFSYDLTVDASKCKSLAQARSSFWNDLNVRNMVHVPPAAGAYGSDDRRDGQERAYGTFFGAPYNGALPWQHAATVGKCQDHPGYTTVGIWRVDTEAQRGWGKGNHGPAVSNGSYLVSFPFDFGTDQAAQAATAITFSPSVGGNRSDPKIVGDACPVLTGLNTRPGTCWSLKASYEGYSNLIRVSTYRQQDIVDGKFIKVYGAKASR